MCFHWVITIVILLGGVDFWLGGGGIFQLAGRWANFWLVGKALFPGATWKLKDLSYEPETLLTFLIFSSDFFLGEKKYILNFQGLIHFCTEGSCKIYLNINKNLLTLLLFFFIGLLSYRGSCKTATCPSFSIFFRNDSIIFFGFWARWLIIGISKNLQSPFLREIHFCPNLGKKGQKLPQKCFFFIFKKILSLVFLGNNLKWKLILLLIFYHQCRILQNSGF